MNTEIERKYLVHLEKWNKIQPSKSTHIAQAYLISEKGKTIRVRVEDDKAFLTIKTIAVGISRSEFEYDIPKEDALELIKQFNLTILEKIRHYVHFGNSLWEVDEFLGNNVGLFVAEIELDSETEQIEKPDWISEEVTPDHRYANSQLVSHPYSTWKTI